jgi:hypothetical protein
MLLELCVFNQACAHELVMDIFDVLHACNEVKKKKNHVNKDQGWEPIHQKYKANENTSRHNPKNKSKQSTKSK